MDKTLTIDTEVVHRSDATSASATNGRSQRSQPAERVVRVLEALRSHPDEGLRFAEVARAASVSQATCHAILATLVDAGYVTRDDPAKTYSLGPALVPLAAGAARALRYARAVRPVLHELSQRTGLACSVAEAVGDSITMVAVVTPPGVDVPVREGARVPLAPPFGAIHLAWSDEAAVDAWVARVTNDAMTPARLRAVVHDHRRTRVAIAPFTPASERVRGILAELATDDHAGDLRARTLDLLASVDRLDYTSAELAGLDPVPVNTITAPVLDDAPSVAFAVGVHVAQPALPAARLRTLVDELHRVTDRLSNLVATVPEGAS